MITELHIQNYKSILDDKIELSNVNVLIGENGSGKTNYLEAVAMFSAAKTGNLSINNLADKGVRITKPNLTLSSFLGKNQQNDINIKCVVKDKHDVHSILSAKLTPNKKDDIYTEWTDRTDQVLSRFSKEVQTSFLEQIITENPELSDHLNQLAEILKERLSLLPDRFFFEKYAIYNLETQALRGITNHSKLIPLGINGEGLDILLNDFSEEEWTELLEYKYLISWLEDIETDTNDVRKYKGHKLGRSNSILYFKDKFMSRKNNIFAAENSNEGILHILFYLALIISKKTPKFFAIDNIETALNPKLCRTVMKEIAKLAIKHDKQIIITTHNPAILDGLNLHDDQQRLFVIKRTDEGYTKSERIKLKPKIDTKLKLSEMWMRGYLGGLPTNF
jgi:predicted ATPase